MEMVKVLVPDYYKKFHCIGSKCPNTCCGNWGNISIDNESYKKYKKYQKKASPEFAEKLKTGFKPVFREDGSVNHRSAALVVFKENQMCPFLTENKLCEIQQKIGYQYLSDTCKYYPRLAFVNVNVNLETHLTLSCPEVARLALLRNDKQKFIEIYMEKKEINTRFTLKTFESNALYKYAKEIRQNCIEIMQNEEHSILQRILTMAHFLQGMQKTVSNIPDTNIELSLKPEKIILALKDNPSFKELIHFIIGIFKNIVKEESMSEIRLIDAYKYIITESRTEWEKTIKNKALIFENYFVNYIFNMIFPFLTEQLNMFQHVFLLWERYELCRVYLCAYAIKFGEIRDEHIVEIASKIEKYLSHETLQKRIDRILKVYTATID